MCEDGCEETCVVRGCVVLCCIVLSEVATNYRSSPTPTSSVALLVASLLAARRENTNTTTKYNDKYKIQHTLGQLQSEAPDCQQLYFSRSLKSLSSTSPSSASLVAGCTPVPTQLGYTHTHCLSSAFQTLLCTDWLFSFLESFAFLFVIIVSSFSFFRVSMLPIMCDSRHSRSILMIQKCDFFNRWQIDSVLHRFLALFHATCQTRRDTAQRALLSHCQVQVHELAKTHTRAQWQVWVVMQLERSVCTMCTI